MLASYFVSSATTWLMTLPSALPFSSPITVFMIIPLFLVASTSANLLVRISFTSSALKSYHHSPCKKKYENTYKAYGINCTEFLAYCGKYKVFCYNRYACWHSSCKTAAQKTTCSYGKKRLYYLVASSVNICPRVFPCGNSYSYKVGGQAVLGRQ